MATLWTQQEELLKDKMTKLFKQYRQRIGAGKMKLYLEHDESIGFYVSLKRIKRLMTVLHFKCQSQIKKYHRVKQAEQEVRDNILNQQFDRPPSNQKYVPTRHTLRQRTYRTVVERVQAELAS